MHPTRKLALEGGHVEAVGAPRIYVQLPHDAFAGVEVKVLRPHTMALGELWIRQRFPHASGLAATFVVTRVRCSTRCVVSVENTTMRMDLAIVLRSSLVEFELLAECTHRTLQICSWGSTTTAVWA